MRLHDLAPRPGAKAPDQAPRLRRKLRPRQDQRQGPQRPEGPFGRQHPPRVRGRPDAAHPALAQARVQQRQFKNKILIVNLGRTRSPGFYRHDQRGRPARARHHSRQVRRHQGTRRGELKKKVAIEVDHISASAREKIEAAGGSMTLRPPKPVQTKQPKKAAAKA